MRRCRSLLLVACLGLGVVSAAGAELTGLVRDNLGNGLSNIFLNANNLSGTNFLELPTVTDEAGRFEFSGGAGNWWIEVEPTQLYARGCFDLPSQSLTITNQAAIRFTVRKLDFTHRLAARVIDEAGRPLAGYSLHAEISENGASFKTNVVTGTNWTLVGFRIAENGRIVIEEPPEPSRQTAFYRAVWIQ